jgi:ferritin-like metal-binding protein YciE
MASIDSLHTLLVEEVQDLYDAERRLVRAIPKMAKAAANEDLVSALESHLEETQQQVSRLEEVFGMLDSPAKAKTCAGMKGIIEEGDEHLKEDYEMDSLRDAAIIGAAQRVEHYEIAAYGTAIAHARQLGLDQVVRSLEQTLEEEKAADVKLSDIAESSINIEASEDDEEEMDAAPPRSPNLSARTRSRSRSS